MKVKILKELPTSKADKKIDKPKKKPIPKKPNKARDDYLKFYDDIKIPGNGRNDW